MIQFLHEQLLHPDLKSAWHKARADYIRQHSDLPVPKLKCSYRPSAIQALYYSIGRITRGKPITYAKPGRSKHNRLPAKALDVHFPSTYSWDEQRKCYHLFASFMNEHGLVWGGSWTQLRDLGHFELP